MRILSWIIILACVILLVYCVCHPQETADGTTMGEMIMHFGWGAAFVPGLYYALLWSNLTDDDKETINENFGLLGIIGRILPLFVFVTFPIVRRNFNFGKRFAVLSSSAFMFIAACLYFHVNLLVFQKEYSKMLKTKQHEKDLLKSMNYNNS